MLKSEKKTISGHVYEVTQLPYSLGHKLLLRLYKVLGPSVAKAIAHAPPLEGKKIGDLDIRTIAPAFASGAEQLAADLSEEDFDFMVDTLAEYTHLINDKGHKLKLTDQKEFLFAGNYLELFKWLGFALRVNYLGFMKGRDVLGDLAHLQTKTASPSQKELTGTSTE